MIATLAAFRALAGDALIAVGETVRGGSANVDVDFDDTIKRHTHDYGWHAPFHTGAMEIDGPMIAEPIPGAEVRAALDDLCDSQLLNIAAHVIEGWSPILLQATRSATDVDLLVAALRDRASQFAAVEIDAEQPFLTPVQLDAHLSNSSQSRD